MHDRHEQARLMYKMAALTGLAGTAYPAKQKVKLADELADLAVESDATHAAARAELEDLDEPGDEPGEADEKSTEG